MVFRQGSTLILVVIVVHLQTVVVMNASWCVDGVLWIYIIHVPDEDMLSKQLLDVKCTTV